MMRKVAASAALLCAALSGACQHGDVTPAAAEVQDGRAIAQAQCSSCHAIGYMDSSPRQDAPPFREIGRRYQFPVLQQELMEGIKLGHPDMPRFQFSPRGTDALVAYLRDLQVADRETFSDAPPPQ
jgi:cytochrome c